MCPRAKKYHDPDAVIPLTEDECPPFVGYVRKSTDESSEKQAASIPQQIEGIKEYVERNKIVLMPRPSSEPLDDRTIDEIKRDNASDPSAARDLIAFYTEYWIVSERKSAKKPFIRKKWRKLIDDIRKGYIRGVIGYSPDRMSRNLQEGGELIQLVDDKFTRLKFSTFHFEDNASGHMMLGFCLVFAEHYSRKLREDVLRGTKKKHKEGKASGLRKWGYAVNEDKLFVPDSFHFPILRKAFERKIFDKWSDNRIAEEMDNAGWHQELKKYGDGRSSKITGKKISNNGLWTDPFYFGLFVRTFKSHEVKTDLRELDYEGYKFKPLITEEEWELLQEQITSKESRQVKRRKSQKGLELEPIKPISDGLLTMKGGRAFNFMLPNRARFDRKAKNEGKELIDIVKMDQIRYRHQGVTKRDTVEYKWSEIDSVLFKEFKKIRVSEQDYQAYLYIKVQEIGQKRDERISLLRSLEVRINKKTNEQEYFYKNSAYGTGLTGKPKDVWEKEEQQYERKIEKLSQQKKELADDNRDYLVEQRHFFELIANLPELWKKANYVQKRGITDILLLNITSTPEKRLTVNIKPELQDLFILDGAQERT